MITKYITLTGAFLGYYIKMTARDLFHLRLMIEDSCLKTMYCHWYNYDEIKKQKKEYDIIELTKFKQQMLNYDYHKVEAIYKQAMGEDYSEV